MFEAVENISFRGNFNFPFCVQLHVIIIYRHL